MLTTSTPPRPDSAFAGTCSGAGQSTQLPSIRTAYGDRLRGSRLPDCANNVMPLFICLNAYTGKTPAMWAEPLVLKWIIIDPSCARSPWLHHHPDGEMILAHSQTMSKLHQSSPKATVCTAKKSRWNSTLRWLQENSSVRDTLKDFLTDRATEACPRTCRLSVKCSHRISFRRGQSDCPSWTLWTVAWQKPYWLHEISPPLTTPKWTDLLYGPPA